MSDEELFNALDGLHAYDMGATDSGIHDEALRERVKKDLQGDDATARITSFLRQSYYLEPYTVVDVADFIKWLADPMGCWVY